MKQHLQLRTVAGCALVLHTYLFVASLVFLDPSFSGYGSGSLWVVGHNRNDPTLPTSDILLVLAKPAPTPTSTPTPQNKTRNGKGSPAFCNLGRRAAWGLIPSRAQRFHLWDARARPSHCRRKAAGWFCVSPDGERFPTPTRNGFQKGTL